MRRALLWILMAVLLLAASACTSEGWTRGSSTWTPRDYYRSPADRGCACDCDDRR